MTGPGLVRGVRGPGSSRRTARRRRPQPFGLSLVALTQAEVEQLEAQYPKLEDILPLSPLQEGLLFHALYDTQGPDLYTVQLVFGLEGPLDAQGLQAAAEALLRRHTSLRACFHPPGSEPASPSHPARGGASLADNRPLRA